MSATTVDLHRLKCGYEYLDSRRDWKGSWSLDWGVGGIYKIAIVIVIQEFRCIRKQAKTEREWCKESVGGVKELGASRGVKELQRGCLSK